MMALTIRMPASLLWSMVEESSCRKQNSAVGKTPATPSTMWESSRYSRNPRRLPQSFPAALLPSTLRKGLMNKAPNFLNSGMRFKVEDSERIMEKADALKHGSCSECKRIVVIFNNPETDFGICNGHIFHRRLTFDFDMPCLCGERVFETPAGKPEREHGFDVVYQNREGVTLSS